MFFSRLRYLQDSLKCLKRRRAQELSEANHHASLGSSKQHLNKFPASDVSLMWVVHWLFSVHKELAE